MWYFYILQSTDRNDFFYRGSSADLRKRLEQHNNGEVQSTKHYRPLRLVYYEAYISQKAARIRERSVKKSGSVWTPLMKRVRESLT